MYRYIPVMLLVMCSTIGAEDANMYDYERDQAVQELANDEESFEQQNLHSFIYGVANALAVRYVLDKPVEESAIRMIDYVSSHCKVPEGEKHVQLETPELVVSAGISFVAVALIGGALGKIKSAIGRKVSMPIWQHVDPHFSKASFSQGYSVGHLLASLYYLFEEKYDNATIPNSLVAELSDGMAG